MCENPNYLIKTGFFNPDTGKEVLHFANFELVQKIRANVITEDRYYKVPCGKCRICQINKSKEWASRCMAEATLYSSNYFLTLTYSDENLPENFSLRKKHLQDFNKRLREYYRVRYNHVGIRFYSSGEYGDNTFRPHYHGCYFNLPINDLKLYKVSKTGFVYYNSELINSLWGFGFVVIGDVTPASAAYVARYVAKKQYGKNTQIYADLGIEPEFSLMSNRPGIGFDFCIENLDKIFKYDKIYLPSEPGKNPEYKIPRYFKKLGEKYIPDSTFESKERLQTYAKFLNSLELSKTDLSEDEYIFEKNESEKNRLKTLTQHVF